MIGPPADRVLPAHPKKMRMSAESTRKSDKLDARVPAECLALDVIPQQPVEQCRVAACGRRKPLYGVTHKGWRYTWATGNDFFNRLLGFSTGDRVNGGLWVHPISGGTV